jgi:hypothetical protein
MVMKLVWLLVVLSCMSSVRPEIQLKLGGGLHLEENQAIVYESSVPLVYEMNWEDPKDLPEDVSIVPDTTKWAQCYSNSTCTLRKIFSDYRKAINIQLDNLEPHLDTFKSKQRRFSVMGWILNHCCGVATQDEFEELYRAEDQMEAHINNMKSTVHEDHRALTQLVTNADELAKDFNGILGRAKSTLTNMMLEEVNIEAREQLVVRNIISVYTSLDLLIRKIRKNIAASSCQNKKIPANIISPNILRADLSNLTLQLSSKEWILSVPVSRIGKYYGLPIAACSMSSGKIVVRIKVPIQRAGRAWKGFTVKAVPIGDTNSTCTQVLPGPYIVLSEQSGKMSWLSDVRHCQPESTGLCFIPRGVEVLRVAAMCEDRCQMVCRPENNTSITPLGNNVFAITHPPTSFQIHCHQKEVEFLRLPAVVHGYLEMEVPCDCKAIVDEHHHIDSIFPCDDRWSQNLTTHHIIPSTWISLPQEDIGKVLQNDSLQYEAKLNALLSEGWETKPKSVFVVPESVSEDVSLYSKFRESAGEYHVEWTTVVTVLVIIILFRQPINILLVRLVSCGGRDDPPDGFHRP